MRIVVPDLISNSYFPTVAAVQLGYLRAEGVDAELELQFPVTEAGLALQRGEIDFLAGAAHTVFTVDQEEEPVQLLAALAQHMYWFLVVRTDLEAENLADLHDVAVGAAPGPDLGLRRLLERSGVDAERAGIRIGPVPGSTVGGVSFGVTAADALAEGRIDAFWANGMGAAVAVQRGSGRVILDARRDDSPGRCCTFPALMARRSTVEDDPRLTTAVTRAVLSAQRDLRANPALATDAVRGIFPSMEAQLIAGLVERDAPFYDPVVSTEALDGLADLAESQGLVASADTSRVVAPLARSIWPSFAPAEPTR
jgi:ABC-type nitrate/sulfonate/bicarbonate transport system substrate-binding protein